MKNRMCVLLMALFLLAQGAHAENTITIGEISASAGSTVILPVSLANSATLSGLEFHLALPAGVTVEKNNQTDRTMDMFLGCNLSDGVYKYSCLSFGGNRILGNDGNILNIVLNVPSTISGGNYTITISHAMCFAEDGSEIAMDDATGRLSVAALPMDEVVIVDGIEYYATETLDDVTVTYVRTFQDNSWQPLYIPFTLKETEWKDKIKLAHVNVVAQYDDDEDGEIDRTVIIFNTRKGGDIQPNTPYLVKPLEKGEMTFTAENTTLMATPEEDAYIDCASTKSIFKIAGTYQEKSGVGDNAYGFASGMFKKLGEHESIKPFGVYLTVTERSGSGGLKNAPRQAQHGPQEIQISIDGEEVANEVFELSEGWNWVSSNMSGIKDARAFIAPVAGNVTRLVSQTEELVNDPTFGLVGDLKTLDPTKAYKLCMKEAVSLNFTETVVNPLLMPIVLQSGWNWLGFTPNEPMSLDEALQSLDASEGDLIKGMDDFAVFSGGRWTGSLALLEPGTGYMYHSACAKAFLYPARSSAGNTIETAFAYSQEPELPWTANLHKYADNATVIARLVPNDKDCDGSDGWIVCAFADDECRGVGKWIDGHLFITIHGDAKDGIVTFRAINNTMDVERGISETMQFADDMLGTLSQPFELHLLSGDTAVPTPTALDSDIEVCNMAGIVVYKGKRANLPQNLSGLYILKHGDKIVKCNL